MLVAFVLLGTVIEGAYFFRVVQVLYFKGNPTDLQREEAPVQALIPIFILIVLIVMVGVYPKPMTAILNSASSELLNRIEYIRSVLG